MDKNSRNIWQICEFAFFNYDIFVVGKVCISITPNPAQSITLSAKQNQSDYLWSKRRIWLKRTKKKRKIKLRASHTAHASQCSSRNCHKLAEVTQIPVLVKPVPLKLDKFLRTSFQSTCPHLKEICFRCFVNIRKYAKKMIENYPTPQPLFWIFSKKSSNFRGTVFPLNMRSLTEGKRFARDLLFHNATENIRGVHNPKGQRDTPKKGSATSHLFFSSASLFQRRLQLLNFWK